MIESNMRKTVVKLLRSLHAVSVENGMACPGTPDVNCTLGWVELKATNNWPVRPTTIVRLDHDLSPQQRIWLIKRAKAGGACWVLLTVATDWLLFEGSAAALSLGKVNKADLFNLALHTWDRTPTSEHLIACLQPAN